MKSIKHDYFYKGHCDNPESRLKEHNAGMTISIRPYIPFKIAYIEKFQTKKEARAREKYFKTAAGRRYLKKVIP